MACATIRKYKKKNPLFFASFMTALWRSKQKLHKKLNGTAKSPGGEWWLRGEEKYSFKGSQRVHNDLSHILAQKGPIIQFANSFVAFQF